MRVVIQSFNDVAGVREIGAMVSESVRLRMTVRVVVVEHGDARHGFPTLMRPNVGRDYGAFIWYVVEHYEELEGSYVFTSANLGTTSPRWRGAPEI